MKAVLQRVKRASVTVDGNLVGSIHEGLLVLLGVSATDTDKQADVLLEKIVNLRIFNDAEGKMNLSLIDARGGLLVVSQFTLLADTRKGRRPSYIHAARPDDANRLYQYFVNKAKMLLQDVQTGKFQAMMDVELVNDGPVTIILDTDDLK